MPISPASLVAMIRPCRSSPMLQPGVRAALITRSRSDCDDRAGTSRTLEDGRHVKRSRVERVCHDALMSEEDDEKAALWEFLQIQRSAVRSIVSDLSEEAWHTSVVPSGWTPAGFVEHLGGAEYHWFQSIISGVEFDPPDDEDFEPYDPNAAFTSDLPSAEILRNYQEECDRSDEVLAGATGLTKPLGRHFDQDVPSVRWG